MRVLSPLLVLALVAPAALLAAPFATAACKEQPVHTYTTPGAGGLDRGAGVVSGAGVIWVADTNLVDCDGDGTPADWDGDYNVGEGGAAFGWGPWASDPDCGFGVFVHGPYVLVSDVTFAEVAFTIGEDDMDGPQVVTDATGATTCMTDGMITPDMDPDDCISPVYVTRGQTCGTGGGDGLYWVFIGFTSEGGPIPSKVRGATTGFVVADDVPLK